MRGLYQFTFPKKRPCFQSDTGDEFVYLWGVTSASAGTPSLWFGVPARCLSHPTIGPPDHCSGGAVLIIGSSLSRCDLKLNPLPDDRLQDHRTQKCSPGKIWPFCSGASPALVWQQTSCLAAKQPRSQRPESALIERSSLWPQRASRLCNPVAPMLHCRLETHQHRHRRKFAAARPST